MPLSPRQLSRRRFLGAASATATCSILSQSCTAGPTAQSSQQILGSQAEAIAGAPVIRLGFIALTDAAPLIIAKEKGYFQKHGLSQVEIIRQASWGATRDNLVRGGAAGGIEGAHILTPMPYQMTAGTITDGKPLEMNILARLNVNGQGISLANIYKSLKVGLHSDRLQDAVTAAMTFPGGYARFVDSLLARGGRHCPWC